MRWSLRRPIRSTRTPIETLSTESRLAAERLGTGSSAGSRTTSLWRPRIVVVHGAINARPSRGIAASRDSTTTGRRPTSGSSHHQISPRRGWSRSRRGFAERSQVTPLILVVERHRVVRGVASVDFSHALARDEGLERGVQQRGIVQIAACRAGARKEVLIHRGAHTSTRHAISMPWLCHIHDALPRSPAGDISLASARLVLATRRTVREETGRVRIAGRALGASSEAPRSIGK